MRRNKYYKYKGLFLREEKEYGMPYSTFCVISGTGPAWYQTKSPRSKKTLLRKQFMSLSDSEKETYRIYRDAEKSKWTKENTEQANQQIPQFPDTGKMVEIKRS